MREANRISSQAWLQFPNIVFSVSSSKIDEKNVSLNLLLSNVLAIKKRWRKFQITNPVSRVIIRLTEILELIRARLYFDAKSSRVEYAKRGAQRNSFPLVERNDEEKNDRKHIEPDSLRIRMKLFASGSRVIDNSKLFFPPSFLPVESKNRAVEHSLTRNEIPKYSTLIASPPGIRKKNLHKRVRRTRVAETMDRNEG